MICYELSSRQRKELLLRFRAITLALPLAPGIRDPLEFARSVLQPEYRPLIHSAVRSTVVVSLLHRPADGLGYFLGSIGPPAGSAWVMEVGVIRVELRPRVAHNPPLTDPQWPASVQVYVNGVRIKSEPPTTGLARPAVAAPDDRIDFDALPAAVKERIYQECETITPASARAVTIPVTIPAPAPAPTPVPISKPPVRPSFPPAPLAEIRGWSPPAAMVERMGHESDKILGAEFGVSAETASNARERLGIPPFAAGAPASEWTPEQDALLGTATDAAVGEQLGRPQYVAKARREKLGIPAFRKSAPWTQERVEILRAEPDNAKAAALLGLSVKGVQSARRRYLD